MAKPPPKPPGAALPTKEEIAKFLAEHPGKAGKREIARAFGITGDARIELKRLLAEMKDQGVIGRERRRGLVAAGALPSITVIEVIATPADGEMLARPVQWPEGLQAPEIDVVPGRHPGPAPGIGDRVLARIERVEDHAGQPRYQAKIIRALSREAERVLGVIRIENSGEARLVTTDRRAKSDFRVEAADLNGAVEGELVEAETLPGRPMGLPKVRVRRRLGAMDSPKSISLIAIHSHGIPVAFPPEAVQEAKKAKPVALGKREDLRPLPLITIDPADARDHDDAVFAEPDEDPKNPGGHHVVVAIADVAHYVRPGSALDRAAKERGNSAYFPDRVVPMLPEELSTDLCSLIEGQDRAALAVHMWLDSEGNKIRHRFTRALIRIVAGVHYAQAQDAIDGRTDEITKGLLDPVLKPLWAAWKAVMIAREKREPLEIDAPERLVKLGEDGTVQSIEPRQRLDAHRVIEEFMILANVAAAEELETRRQPCMYRVHDQPTATKLEALREFLRTIDIKLAKGQVLKPRQFNGILARTAEGPHARAVAEIVLRSQAQAVYSPENMGHFGLALRRYAHFTSPIRRYADILVHRALIRGGKLGDGGLSDDEVPLFEETAEHISTTERRAMAAERESTERYLAAFMQDRVGARFTARVNGVTRFGLFITLEDTGASGLVPISSLGADFFRHDEAAHALVGRNPSNRFALGDAVKVVLREATPLTGGLLFAIARPGGEDEDFEPPPAFPRFRRGASASRGRAPLKKNRKRS
ncbi:ribonuclease R [Zavarzinia compransoris]|uniref:ribonuclease R n=1 Tax=Zavarzinia compransoris TaxID=1264899 RepID=UPI0010E4E74B|nr:ribonuclease R [Zavarzinia compransoris]TDP43305.1 RNAse R [Zavarzinia compransoris]